MAASTFVVLALLGTACGSRLSQDEIALKARGASSSREANEDERRSLDVADIDPSSTDETTPDDPTDDASDGGRSSGRSDGSTEGDSGAPGDQRRVVGAVGVDGTKAPIVIGTVGNMSGPAGAAQVPAVHATQAWVQMMNDRGGLDGHPIVHHVVDDGSDPARNAAAVRDLVENEGVIAFVGNEASQSNHGGADYLAAKGIPVVGGDASTELWYSNPMFFPQTGDFRSTQLLSLRAMAKLTDGRNLGILVCQEAQVCTEGERAYLEAARATGWRVAYNGKASIAQPDYTANCLSARGEDVDVLGVIFDGPSVKRIARSCAAQGFRPKFIHAAADESFATSDFEESVLVSIVFPFAGVDLPAAREFHEAMARYAPDVPIGNVATLGWVAAKMFERIAPHLGDEPSTADVLEGLYSLDGDTLGGLSAPRTFVRGQPAPPVRCGFTMVVSDGKWTAPNGATLQCDR